MTDRTGLIVEQIPYLRRYARALAGNAEQADELVQSCLERALSRLSLFRSGSNMRAWLFTILHNLHANAVRDSSRRPATIPLSEMSSPPASSPTQETEIQAQNAVDALALLPEEQRAALLLVGLEELGYREAAAVLGIPVGTLMSRLNRGRERLRAILSEGNNTPLKSAK